MAKNKKRNLTHVSRISSRKIEFSRKKISMFSQIRMHEFNDTKDTKMSNSINPIKFETLNKIFSRENIVIFFAKKSKHT